MILWAKRGSCLHTHLRSSGLWRWFTWVNKKEHTQLCEKIKQQTHDHELTKEEVEAIAATHQAHNRWKWLLILLFFPFVTHGQGTINVIPQKQFMDSLNHAFNVTCVSGCSASAGFTDNTAFTVGTNSITNLGAYFTSGADPALSSGNSGRVRMDAHSYLFVDCVIGCAGGSTTPADAFTNPTAAGLQFDLLAGFNGTTWDRLRSSITNGLQVDVTRVQGNVAVTGTFFQATQPVSCASAATCPVNASQVGGPWTQNTTQWNSVSLGNPSAYGTSPGAVNVPGVNAFITNTPAVTLASTTVTNTVSENLAQVNGNTVSTATTGVQKVGIVGNAAATLDSTIGAATAPTNAIATSGVFQSTVPTLTAGQAVAVQVDTTGSQYVNPEGRKTSYRAASVAQTAIASATAPTFSLTGSSTKTVRITKIRVSCSAATGGVADVQLVRFSALSGGTSAAITIGKNDSGNATATAAPLTWSVAATTATSAGVMASQRYELVTPTATAVVPELIQWQFGDVAGSQQFVLRGTSEFMGVRFSSIATTPTCDIWVEWTEE